MTPTERIERLKQLYIDAIANAQDIDARYNDRFADAQARIDAIHAEFNNANAELITLRNETHDTLADTEQDLRDGLVAWHESTGDKTFDSDLGVRVTKSLSYDVKDAVRWAEINAPVMVQKTIDKKAFESLPTVAELEFVTAQNKVVSTISKTLPKEAKS